MRLGVKIGLAALLSFCAVLLAVCMGSVPLGVADTLRIFAHKVFGAPLPAGVSTASVAILWTVRLPRVLLAFCVGAMLSVSGTVMQSVLRNPLASPFTLGVSSGASLGAALVILTGFALPGLGGYTLPLVGLLSGLLAAFLAVTFASRVDRGMRSTTVILAGMVFSLFINALLTLLYALAKENIQRLLQWQMGGFALRGWTELWLLAPVGIVGVLLVTGFHREMDLLTFGEEDAGAVGVDTRRVKWLLLGLSTALTGSAVAFAGVIGFIDLIAPHIVRKVFGARHVVVVPMSALLGGGFMAVCDMAARVVTAPLELPVGAVTALIGAPFFAYVYFRRGREEGGA
ncbi:MAG: iron ABC transporter permease [Firmicutes bacterium]|nr:iron ABC transporter permease [Bacillota bacterium]